MTSPTISDQAEAEMWSVIRDDARSSLSRATTVSFIYLIAALAVGAFLLSAVAELSEDAVYYVGWEEKEVLITWMRSLIWVYAGIAVAASVIWILVQLSLRGSLPVVIATIVSKIPGLGRAIQTIDRWSTQKLMATPFEPPLTKLDSLRFGFGSIAPPRDWTPANHGKTPFSAHQSKTIPWRR